MTPDTVGQQLRRQAIRAMVGGFRPPQSHTASWIVRVSAALPGEAWPTFEGTYRIEDLGGGRVSLSITEDGEVKNVPFRFLSRYVLGHDKTVKLYHANLEAELS